MKFEPTESDYNEYVELVTPTSSVPRNCLWAFLVGGVICTIGQGIFDLLVHFDVKEDEAYAYVSLILVLASVILTSLNLYKKIAKYGGAEPVRQYRKSCRSRNNCADHRICKWCVRAHSGIPDGG